MSGPRVVIAVTVAVDFATQVNRLLTSVNCGSVAPKSHASAGGRHG
jgi:hypothetical protein